jgi:4a-hydroxytetrahydrobiopterin dehydratase
MTQMAEFSERVQHHPEWVNVYNRVEIQLTTHDAGGLTQKDIDWAQEANRCFGGFQ